MPNRFAEVVRYLPPRLRERLERLSEEQRGRVEEIRLRIGCPLCVTAENRELVPEGGETVTGGEIEHIMETISGGSLHTVMDSLRHGFITVQGGHRVGICGTAALRDGTFCHLRHPSSLCIRIARDKKGVAKRVLPSLLRCGMLPNTLILSPPGTGKTTLLRDLVRMLSDGSPALPSLRVAVADERGEIAACHNGIPQLEVGSHTDVWTGLSKGDAAMLLLRGFSPQVIAMDELSAPEDIKAAELCVGCGVTVLATAHAASAEDLWRRPLYRPLAEIFPLVVVITGEGQKRRYHIQEVQGLCQAS